jgi:DNA-binding NarL/FixJ family response regulator
MVMDDEKIKILVADDHPMIIEGLTLALSGSDSVSVVAKAREGEEVLSNLRKESVDVILLDINMPGLNGFETIKKIKPEYPEIKIIVLTMYDKPEFIRSVIESGANGYLLKNTGKDEMILAIQKVYRGETFFSQDVQKILKKEESDPNSSVHLTRREKEVLCLIAREKTTPEIAEELFISTHTVDTHRKNLLAKLNVKNAAGLVKYAMDNGITRSF